MRLNLGACDRRVEGFISVDICEPADQIVDLAGPWPWEESSVEEVFAFDVIEHIGDCGHCNYSESCAPTYACAKCATLAGSINPYRNFGLPEFQRHPLGRIHFMNELHRVLKPGARATIETPDASRGVGFWQDPTHVSPWCRSTFKYFEHGAFAHTRLSKAYGITAAFRVIEMTALGPMPGEGYGEQVWKIRAVLECVK